jgi:hypothetical protein
MSPLFWQRFRRTYRTRMVPLSLGITLAVYAITIYADPKGGSFAYYFVLLGTALTVSVPLTLALVAILGKELDP